MAWLKKFFAAVGKFFSSAPAPQVPAPQLLVITTMTIEGTKNLQTRLNVHGAKLTVDGVAGPVTMSALIKFKLSRGLGDMGSLDSATIKALRLDPAPQTKPVIPSQNAENPAYKKAQTFIGKTESDPAFNKYLSGFWGMVGLPHYKTIIGSSFAWCALFIVAVNSEVGQDYLASASAKRQGAYGVEVVWQKQGIPKGAVIHINHSAADAKTAAEHDELCKSSSSNHVGFADGDCMAEDYFPADVEMYKDKSGVYRAKDLLPKAGSVFAMLGGNQGNMVKRSIYKASEICEVRWPKELPFPNKITKSIGCSGSKASESTQ